MLSPERRIKQSRSVQTSATAAAPNSAVLSAAVTRAVSARDARHQLLRRRPVAARAHQLPISRSGGVIKGDHSSRHKRSMKAVPAAMFVHGAASARGGGCHAASNGGFVPPDSVSGMFNRSVFTVRQRGGGVPAGRWLAAPTFTITLLAAVPLLAGFCAVHALPDTPAADGARKYRSKACCRPTSRRNQAAHVATPVRRQRWRADRCGCCAGEGPLPAAADDVPP